MEERTLLRRVVQQNRRFRRQRDLLGLKNSALAHHLPRKRAAKRKRKTRLPQPRQRNRTPFTTGTHLQDTWSSVQSVRGRSNRRSCSDIQEHAEVRWLNCNQLTHCLRRKPTSPKLPNLYRSDRSIWKILLVCKIMISTSRKTRLKIKRRGQMSWMVKEQGTGKWMQRMISSWTTRLARISSKWMISSILKAACKITRSLRQILMVIRMNLLISETKE